MCFVWVATLMHLSATFSLTGIGSSLYVFWSNFLRSQLTSWWTMFLPDWVVVTSFWFALGIAYKFTSYIFGSFISYVFAPPLYLILPSNSLLTAALLFGFWVSFFRLAVAFCLMYTSATFAVHFKTVENRISSGYARSLDFANLFAEGNYSRRYYPLLWAAPWLGGSLRRILWWTEPGQLQ